MKLVWPVPLGILLEDPPHFVRRGIAHQGVAGPDVEIDVGQGLDAEVFFVGIRLHLGHQLEKKPQLADLHRLFHDIHAEEVIQDDVLENIVAAVGMVLHLFQDLAKVGEFFRPVLFVWSGQGLPQRPPSCPGRPHRAVPGY